MSEPASHIIMFTHRDGQKLDSPETWCGSHIVGWHFADAQHAAQTGKAMGNPRACGECVDAIKQALDVAAWRD